MSSTIAGRRLTYLHYETLVQAPLEATFAFFADASNLQRLTPPWLQFEMRTPTPVEMREGLEIEYRIRLYGVPMRWRSRIDVWEPRHRFVDRQITGPYLWWRHEHRFAPAGDATRVVDDVEYVPRAAWIAGRFVRRDLERIFTYRQNTLREIFRDGKRLGGIDE